MNSTVTDNRNFLQTLNFKLTIDQDTAANVAFFSTTVNLPAVSIGEAPTNFRNQMGWEPGDRVAYEPLIVKFMVDEDMTNWLEVFKWIVAQRSSPQPIKKDLILSVATAKNNVRHQFRFAFAFPTSLSQIDFNVQATDVDYATCEVTFRYDHFDKIK